MSFLKLIGAVQCNSWGHDASQSIIDLFRTSHENLPKDGPLAELWFGNHPKGESRVADSEGTSHLLSDYLKKEHPNYELPYLAKVLSVKNILSIQLHPNEDSAKRLNAKSPKEYPDCSSKPEMAISLGNSSLLCGLRKRKEILELFSLHPAFKCIAAHIGFNEEYETRSLIKSILNLPDKIVERFLEILFEVQSKSDYDLIAIDAYKYLGRVDTGLPLIYLLNLVKLTDGEAVFIPPGIPHAYIKGNLVECMKCSDNVVRGGITPKYVDTEVFCELLSEKEDYDPRISSIEITNGLRRFEPDACPFYIDKITAQPGEMHIPETSSPQMYIVIAGEAEVKMSQDEYHFSKGEAYFMSSPGLPHTISASNFLAFRIVAK